MEAKDLYADYYEAPLKEMKMSINKLKGNL